MSPKSIKCRTAAPPHSRSIKCRTAVPPHRRIQHKIRDPSFFSAWVFGGSLNSDPSRASWLVPGWFLVSFWVQVMTKKHSQGIRWVARVRFQGLVRFWDPFSGKMRQHLNVLHNSEWFRIRDWAKQMKPKWSASSSEPTFFVHEAKLMRAKQTPSNE